MQWFLVKHSLDGLRIALQPQEIDQLVVVGLPLQAVPLLGRPLTGSGTRSGKVQGTEVICVDALQGPHADLLDLWRDPSKRQRAVVLYSRLHDDLPPLRARDEVHCFWEVDDTLSEAYVHHFSQVSERLEDPQIDYRGLTLYRRRPQGQVSWKERGHEIAQLLQQQVNPQPLELPDWSPNRS